MKYQINDNSHVDKDKTDRLKQIIKTDEIIYDNSHVDNNLTDRLKQIIKTDEIPNNRQ